jgi:hypothetical protein
LKQEFAEMFEIQIPKPIQIVIDDVGWWKGHDGHEIGQPFRTGINRDHVYEDYVSIIKLGESLGVRPQAAMILCEWDRENILRDLPDSTWMGKDWDNAGISREQLDRVADYLNSNREYFEFTLHGIGHEFWEDGTMSRAEWYDVDGNMRPAVRQHLDYYAKLMEMNDLGNFPVSFVPCAFYYNFGPAEGNLAKILNEYGIRFMSTPFKNAIFSRNPENKFFGFDHGVIALDRGIDLKNWSNLGAYPGPNDELTHPIVGMHWPQVLHENPARNCEVVDQWIKFLKCHDKMLQWTLARDIKAFSTQLAHASLSKSVVNDNCAVLDLSKFRKLDWPEFSDAVTIKISSEKPLRFLSNNADITVCKKIEEANSIMYTLNISPKDPKAQMLQFEWT